MSLDKEYLPKSTAIKEFVPSKINLIDYEKLGLVNLIRGYGLHGDKNFYIARTRREFSGEDKNTRISIAFQSEKAIGSLVIRKWEKGDNDRGDTFWNTLADLSPDLAREMLTLSKVACYISGIVIAPEFRKKGIAKELMVQAFRDYPSIVVGGTKNPEQVIARVQALSQLGYSTFFGHYLIAPDLTTIKTEKHKSLIKAFLKAAGKKDMFYVSTSVSSEIPRMEGLPSGIIQAFKEVVRRQNRAGSKHAVMQPLISIRKIDLPFLGL